MAGAAKDARAAEQVQREEWRPIRAEANSRLALLMRVADGSGRGLLVSVEWLSAKKSEERQPRQVAGRG